MSDIAIFGLGYVGTVCAACFAANGHRVVGVDPNLTKVEMQTFAVPLARFSTGSPAVSLSNVQAVEITFSASTGQEIHFDTLSMVRI